MVRVPASDAEWSTWKRYCNAAGVLMGRAILALIGRELVSVFGEFTADEGPILAGRAEERLTAREGQVGSRERNGKEAEEHDFSFHQPQSNLAFRPPRFLGSPHPRIPGVAKVSLEPED